MSSNSTLRQAVGLALGTATAASAASLAFVPAAMAADEPADSVALQEVVVTGSRIRRVDAETANPVLVIDRKMIQESGIKNINELVQRLPNVSGAATNPNVNNGGGYGESSLELRGLDARRTLVLVDGRRIGLVGTTSDATDVSQIPFNMIERVEVLKEGAGAIYGSDAIGGVVNFITRKSVDGLEVNADYGRTSHGDAPHHSVDVLLGTSSEKFDLVIGGNYMEQEGLFGGRRKFSTFARYLYSTGEAVGGSGRIPNGHIYANPIGATDSTGAVCDELTRTAGTSGASTSDYRCFTNADRFNFQPLNYITTPVERTSLFSKGNYKINDDVEAYASVTYTHTHSGYHAAPLPFDALSDNIVLSADSIYNPFKIDFGGNSGLNPDFALRTFLFGSRQSDTNSDGTVFNAGLKGNIFKTGWTWDANIAYSRLQQHAQFSGYYFGDKLRAAVGPSFIDDAGTPTCGTAAAPIDGCTPINLFNQDLNDLSALNSVRANFNLDNVYLYKAATLDVTGKIWTLPAGDLQLAIGAEYNDRKGKNIADSLVQAAPPLYLTCGLSQEVCTGNTEGKYSSKQEYIEIYIPILKELPFAHSLSADIGVRHNDYSIFGASTKSDFKVEYRPIKDLLLRGTFSQVLRVPTINDIASSPANTSVTFNDPCTGLTAAAVAATPNLALACQGVPLDGSFAEPNGQITGLITSNPTLKPETGKVKTAGFVFEPSALPGFSFEADYWHYNIEGLITTLDANYSITQCVATGDPQFCNLANRYGADAGQNAGLVKVFLEPSFNLGSLTTSGVDLGSKYALRDTGIGSFQFSIDWTHTNNYTNTPSPGAATQEIAGTYNKQFGNFAKNRAIASISWSWRSIDALVTGRYIGKVDVTHPARDIDTAPLAIGSVFYTDVTVGYAFPFGTRLQAGVRNLSDKQPPNFYQNNVDNVNVDVQTYDVLGRQFFAGFSQKF